MFDGVGAPSEAHQLQVSGVQWDFVAWVMVLPLSLGDSLWSRHAMHMGFQARAILPTGSNDPA